MLCFRHLAGLQDTRLTDQFPLRVKSWIFFSKFQITISDFIRIPRMIENSPKRRFENGVKTETPSATYENMKICFLNTDSKKHINWFMNSCKILAYRLSQKHAIVFTIHPLQLSYHKQLDRTRDEQTRRQKQTSSPDNTEQLVKR